MNDNDMIDIHEAMGDYLTEDNREKKANTVMFVGIALALFIALMPIVLGWFGLECPCVYLFRWMNQK